MTSCRICVVAGAVGNQDFKCLQVPTTLRGPKRAAVGGREVFEWNSFGVHALRAGWAAVCCIRHGVVGDGPRLALIFAAKICRSARAGLLARKPCLHTHGWLYTRPYTLYLYFVRICATRQHSVPVISSLSLFQGSWSLIQALKYHRIR